MGGNVVCFLLWGRGEGRQKPVPSALETVGGGISEQRLGDAGCRIAWVVVPSGFVSHAFVSSNVADHMKFNPRSLGRISLDEDDVVITWPGNVRVI